MSSSARLWSLKKSPLLVGTLPYWSLETLLVISERDGNWFLTIQNQSLPRSRFFAPRPSQVYQVNRTKQCHKPIPDSNEVRPAQGLFFRIIRIGTQIGRLPSVVSVWSCFLD